jgi:hypothetical protein
MKLKIRAVIYSFDYFSIFEMLQTPRLNLKCRTIQGVVFDQAL